MAIGVDDVRRQLRLGEDGRRDSRSSSVGAPEGQAMTAETRPPMAVPLQPETLRRPEVFPDTEASPDETRRLSPRERSRGNGPQQSYREVAARGQLRWVAETPEER